MCAQELHQLIPPADFIFGKPDAKWATILTLWMFPLFVPSGLIFDKLHTSNIRTSVNILSQKSYKKLKRLLVSVLIIASVDHITYLENTVVAGEPYLTFLHAVTNKTVSTKKLPLTHYVYKIFVPHNEEILYYAKKLKRLIKRLLTTLVTIVRKTKRDGNIILTLNKQLSPAIGKIVTTGHRRPQKLAVIASTPKMLMHTSIHMIIQIFLKKKLAQVTVVNYQVQERILLLDMGRKFYSKHIIKRLIDSMFLAQFNYLQLHFSENQGFRIESMAMPEVVSDEHLTQNDVREIIKYARKFGIEIIPDFDTPGHVAQILVHHRNMALNKRKYPSNVNNVKTIPYDFCNNDPSVCALNITDPTAVQMILTLYKEFGQLFLGNNYFHIGGDEFIDFDMQDMYPALQEAAVKQFGPSATIVDLTVDYLNKIGEHLIKQGFTPRVWNDAIFESPQVNLSTQIQITYWAKRSENAASLETLLQKGYTVLNYNHDYLYYVLGFNTSMNPRYMFNKILNNWDPSLFPMDQAMTNRSSQYLGVGLSLWSDDPDAKSEEEVWKDATYLLFAVTQQLTQNLFTHRKNIHDVVYRYSDLKMTFNDFEDDVNF